ncbi:MAG: hypothetical protein ACD_28C00109G0003 [uncultured bacterium]|nr:MAG: hypothetical protein ACD_28C00109G0003 [uncultured bacterium]
MSGTEALRSAQEKLSLNGAEHSVDLENLYALWSDADAGRLSLIRVWQPESVDGRFVRNEAFRCWVYVLTSLPPSGFGGDFVQQVAPFFGMESRAFKSILAHFYGDFRLKIKPGSLKEKAIQAVEGFGGRVEAEEIAMDGENNGHSEVLDEESALPEGEGGEFTEEVLLVETSEVEPQAPEMVLDNFPEVNLPSEILDDSTPGRIEVIESFEGEGDVFDYDTKMKKLWRREWMRFIENHVPRKGRKQLKVACLPGRKCLEIPGYLEAGFSPGKIYGFESSKRVQKEFMENAARYGIRGISEPLEEVIEEYGPFDVVMLDFPGPVSPSTINTLQSLSLADNAKVAMNVLSRRDPKVSGWWHELAGPSSNKEMLSIIDGVENLSVVSDLLQRYKMSLFKEGAPIAENRFDAYPYLVGAHAGINSFHSWLFREEISKFSLFDGKDALDVGSTMADVSLRIVDDLVRKFEQSLQLPNAFDIATSFRTLAMSALRGQFIATDVEQMSYQSQKNGSPYLTAMLQLHRPAQFYRRNQVVFKPILRAILDSLAQLETPNLSRPKLQLDLSKSVLGSKFCPKKIEIYYQSSGGRRDSFSLGQLGEAMDEYTLILKKKSAMHVPEKVPVRRLTL